jgi:RNA polymerase sigma factor (sigma-70 family)
MSTVIGVPSPSRRARTARARSTTEAVELIEILRWAVRRACPPSLARDYEDLVQNAALRVLEMERRAELDPIRSTSYLMEVAFTTVVDSLRHISRQPQDHPAEERSEPSMTVLGLRAPRERPALRIAIRGCLEGLTPRRRHVVLLRLQGFSAKEVAQLLRLNVRQVTNLSFRGISDLRHCLAVTKMAE